MKPLDVKHEFVRRRANRESYATIAHALHISKSTCSVWESEMAAEIALQRRDNLHELYNAYGMVKEARVRALGETMRRIDDALDHADLTTIAPERLLDLKLKYVAAMRDEYTGTSDPLPLPADRGTADAVYYATADTLQRLRDGDIGPLQARTELQAISATGEAFAAATDPLSRLTLGQLESLAKLEYSDDTDDN